VTQVEMFVPGHRTTPEETQREKSFPPDAIEARWEEREGD